MCSLGEYMAFVCAPGPSVSVHVCVRAACLPLCHELRPGASD